jgi:hypothetical protein
MRRIGLLFLGVIVPGLLTTLSASAISGTFNMSGTLTATATTLTWQSDMAGFAADMFTTTGGAGSFVGENGQNTVDNLNIAVEPVGTTFANTPFIVFDVVPGLPVLDINFISPGAGGSAGCTAAPAVPQTCTPTNLGGSPFTFSNLQGKMGIDTTASFVFSGVTSDGLSSWQAIFTSAFNTPFQTVLAAFAPGGSGSVTNTFAGTVTVTPLVTVPESSPGLMLASGLGLLLLSLTLKKKYRGTSTQ